MLPTNIKNRFKSLLLLPAENDANLMLWRISILRMLLLTTLVLGGVTVIAMALFPLPDRGLILAVDSAAWLALAFLAFYKPLQHSWRVRLTLSVLFGFWVWLFGEIGMPSLTYLMSIPLFAALLLDLRSALATVVISVLSLFLLGILWFPDYVIGNASALSSRQSWLIVGLNFGFTALLLTVACGLLISRMEAALQLSQESMRLQRQNEKLQAVGTLANGIAHDFNNILMIVVALSESLLERHPDRQTREGLEQILLSSERGRDIVRQLLTFSRQSVPERSVLDLNAVVREMEPLLRAQTPAGIRCHIAYSDNAAIVGSAAEIQQVMMNLIGNAVLAIKPKGQGSVDISLSMLAPGDARLRKLPELDARQNYVCLTVRDDGTGIKAQDMPRLFEPFFTTREPGQGTGLGLASCHGIVSSMGGAIGVESQPGLFTEFAVYLPLHKQSASDVTAAMQPSAPLAAAASAPLSDVQHLGVSVLLVDDELMILQTNRGLLESAGFQVTAANSASEARNRLATGAFSLLITDYSMPNENGMSLIRHARQLFPQLPVILTTGLGQVEEAGLETMEGIVMLNKPYKKADLLQCIMRLLPARTIAKAQVIPGDSAG